MNLRKSVFGIVLAVFLLALCISGAATAGEQLSLTFQEKFNVQTGEQDNSYTGTMDIGLRKWDLPNDPPSDIGNRGTLKIRQDYNANDGTQYPAALIYFPDIVSEINNLPDDGDGPNAGVGPWIDSATLILHAIASSDNPNRDPEIVNPVVLEVSMVTPDTQMWTEADTGWAVSGKTRPRTNASYRYYNTVAWTSPHVYATRSPDAQATAGDHGPVVDYFTLNGMPYASNPPVEFNVLPIVNDWIAGTYANQGFHIGMGVDFFDGDYTLRTEIVSKEGAAGTDNGANPPPPGADLTWAPKLVITYHYTGNVTADAGLDMGEVGDTDPRVKPGETVTLDASASAPVFTGAPLVEYVWSWSSGGVDYTITSPNDQSSAQFSEMLATTDNVTLVVTDIINQSGTDSAKIKVTARIPGDIDGSGVVDLADFVILKNHFGQHN